MTPTAALAEALDRAFAHMNKALFDGALPEVAITSRQLATGIGHYAPARLVCTAGTVGEIGVALHLQDVDALVVLVHEMSHHARCIAGGSIDHDQPWLDLVADIGLNAVEVGGGCYDSAATPGGRFEVAAAELLASGWALPFRDSAPVLDTVRVACRACGVEAWLPRGLVVGCVGTLTGGHDPAPMVPVDQLAAARMRAQEAEHDVDEVLAVPCESCGATVDVVAGDDPADYGMAVLEYGGWACEDCAQSSTPGPSTTAAR